MQAKVGVFSTGTGPVGTTIPVTVGFQPSAILFFWSGRGDTSAGGGRLQGGFGVVASPTDRRCIAIASDDGAASSNSARIARNDACVTTIVPPTTTEGLLDIQSIGPNGFTLVVTNQFEASHEVHYLALGGLTSTVTGQFQESTSAGNQDVTGIGFQPDLVLFISSGVAASTAVNQQVGIFIVGAGKSSVEQAVLGGRSLDNQATMNTRHYVEDNDCLAAFYQQNFYRASFVQMLPDGFRINWSSQTTNATYTQYLALKGGDFRVGSFLTSTGGNDIEVPVGFKPAALLFGSAGYPDSGGTMSETNRISLGAATGPTERGAQAWRDENGAADSNVATAAANDAVYLRLNSNEDTVEGAMDLKSIDANGFTCVMDDPDPDMALVWYVAFGPAEGGETVDLEIDSGYHAHLSTSPKLTVTTDLVIQDARHTASAQNVLLHQLHLLEVEDSGLAHTAGSLALAQRHALLVQGASHTQTSESFWIVQNSSLEIGEALHTQAAEHTALLQTHKLSVQGAHHIQVAEEVRIAPTLSIAHAYQPHVSDEVSFGFGLAIASAAHLLTSEHVAITQTSDLVVDGSRHAHFSSEISLAGTLDIQNARHTHQAEVPGLVPNLAIQNAGHAHWTDALSLGNALSVDSAVHAHFAESLSLAGGLLIESALHAHQADGIGLVQDHFLSVESASHAHLSTDSTLSQEHVLFVSDTSHDHIAGELALVFTLDIGDGYHGHVASGLVFDLSLMIDSASHLHTADQVSFGLLLPWHLLHSSPIGLR